jgi:hypothetical protein
MKSPLHAVMQPKTKSSIKIEGVACVTIALNGMYLLEYTIESPGTDPGKTVLIVTTHETRNGNDLQPNDTSLKAATRGKFSSQQAAKHINLRV